MKRIEAIIKDQYLDSVRDRLCGLGVEEFTVMEVKSFGKERVRAVFRGAEYELSSARLSLTIIAAEYQVDEILDVIVECARTGGVGDGTILVTTIDEVVRIRTAEAGRAVYRV